MKKETLGHICDRNGGLIQTGPFGSQLHQSDYREEGVAVVMPQDIVGDRICDIKIARIDDSLASQLQRHILRKGDIVYPRRGDINKRAIVEESSTQYFCGTGCIKISISAKYICPKWFYYYLGQEHISKWIESKAVGTTMLNLNTSILRSLVVEYPVYGIQQHIAAILSTYDDLIAANQRRIQLLEESARLLYREWFVKLRFPGHETVAVVDGVPEGWELRPASEMIDINPKTIFPKDVSRPFVGMEALSENSMLIEVSDARLISGGAKFRNGDTLLARITPCLENGKTGFVQFLEDDEAAASGSTEFIVLRSRTVNPYWVYCLARSDSFREHAINSMAGSDGRQRVNSKCFDKYLTLQPPSDLLQAFEENVSGMFAQVQSLTEYNRALQQARDLLLPRLMSGALDVSRIAVPREVEV